MQLVQLINFPVILKQLITLEEEKFSLSERLHSTQKQLEKMKNILKFKANLFEESELMNDTIRAKLGENVSITKQLRIKVSQLELELKEMRDRLASSIELPDCVSKLRPWIDPHALIKSILTTLTSITSQIGLTGGAETATCLPLKPMEKLKARQVKVRRRSDPPLGGVTGFVTGLLPSGGLTRGLASSLPYVSYLPYVSTLPSIPQIIQPELQATLTSQIQETLTNQLMLIDDQLKGRLGIDGAKLINDARQINDTYGNWIPIPKFTGWTMEDVKLPSQETSARNEPKIVKPFESMDDSGIDTAPNLGGII